ncbi:hypothetical protein PVK06_027584 [Gossypium arboreum]|uniref:RNase H type-1 domain-containing protein n=1 Tax=Gossypium arboreum TaxID=29729 RepID=A0ABR0P3L9_GOSAR|nr:hypothetical protein PVK06_027584 [Gossypium arboreum]
MEASIGCNPSILWRSIWSSKAILHKGARWRIGNGLTTQIKEDVWIPAQLNSLAQSPCTNFNEESKVCELIDASRMVCKENRIKKDFSKEKPKFQVGIANVCFNRLTSWDLIKLHGSKAKMSKKIKIFCWRVCNNILPSANAATAEAIAAFRAVETTMDMRFSYVIFEGDARVIMKELISKEEDFSEIGQILDKAKSLL